MMEKRGGESAAGEAKVVASEADAVLIEEFCSLVAEIAARSLTKSRQEPENGEVDEGRR
jgi:hypothetical protein